MSNINNYYEVFLNSPTQKQWTEIKPTRRAGVATPLFSIYSKQSVGIGQLPDLKLLVDWAKASGLSIVQILPMNDVGFNFRPYDAESSFAIDPMYLAIDQIKTISVAPFKQELASLKEQFPLIPGTCVNYQIKSAKLTLLWKIFCDNKDKIKQSLTDFKKKNSFWIQDYALYKIFKEKFALRSWVDWPADCRDRQEDFLKQILDSNQDHIDFYCWLQKELFAQFEDVKKYAQKKGVLLMGDMPFLVSRDSSDVWAHKKYFKLELSSGAPPDFCYEAGQKWGMPPWNWNEVASDDYQYLIQKIKTAASFYHLFRIDHFVGIFRLWSIPNELASNQGFFDPADESLWEEHGKKILSVIVQNSSMLPCAEDLGTIPKCSAKVLKEFGVPGLEVQRWAKDDKEEFKPLAEYRAGSVAVISTHDTSPLISWWQTEATAQEKEKFWQLMGLAGEPSKRASKLFIKTALTKINQTNSIFSIQLLQDWLSLGNFEELQDKNYRINFPGIVDDKNWAILMPLSLEKMQKLSINKTIQNICQETGRLI